MSDDDRAPTLATWKGHGYPDRVLFYGATAAGGPRPNPRRATIKRKVDRRAGYRPLAYLLINREWPDGTIHPFHLSPSTKFWAVPLP